MVFTLCPRKLFSRIVALGSTAKTMNVAYAMWNDPETKIKWPASNTDSLILAPLDCNNHSFAGLKKKLVLYRDYLPDATIERQLSNSAKDERRKRYGRQRENRTHRILRFGDGGSTCESYALFPILRGNRRLYEQNQGPQSRGTKNTSFSESGRRFYWRGLAETFRIGSRRNMRARHHLERRLCVRLFLHPHRASLNPIDQRSNS